MKPVLFAALMATCALMAPLSAPAAEYTAEKPLALKLTSFAMPAHPLWADGFVPWAKELKEASNGRLILELYSPNTICPDADVHDCVKSGVLDIGGQASQRVKGTYPLSNVLDLPFMFPTSVVGSYVYMDLLNEFPEFKDEYRDVHLLGAWTGAQYQIHTTKKEIRSLDDIKGLKIGCVTSGLVPTLHALGASVAVVPMTDAYVTLQRGQVDGFAAPYAFMVSTKIYEATKYSYTLNLATSGAPLTMNKRTYESMPPDLRKILDDSVAGYKISHLFASATDAGADRDKLFIQEKGQIINVASEADLARGRELCAPVVEAWYKDCEKRGKGDLARALYARAIELSQKYTVQFQGTK